MKWIGISGTWRYSTPELEEDVIREVTRVIARGDGIVTGGALGVDYLATDVVMRLNPSLERLKVFLPATIEVYGTNYQQRALEGLISPQQAKQVISMLKKIKLVRPACIVENLSVKVVNEHAYSVRNKQVVQASDELFAFQINDSLGTQNTIDSAVKMGKKTTIFSYKIDLK